MTAYPPDMPQSARSKVEKIRDPDTRQYLIDLWPNLMSDAESDKRRKRDERDRDELEYTRDLRMVQKAKAGEYGYEAQELVKDVGSHPTMHAAGMTREAISRIER